MDKLHQYIESLHQTFNHHTRHLDFLLFSLVYALVFLVIAWKTYQRKGWVAPNRELLTPGERIKSAFLKTLMTLPGISWLFRKKLKNEMAKAEEVLDKSYGSLMDPRKILAIPAEGMNEINLKKRITEWLDKEAKLYGTQKISGSIYAHDESYVEEICNFSKDYLYQNPLHFDTFKELSKMESEVIQMTGSLLSKERVYGTLTSGGTESLILAIYAYKKYYNKSRPNIVMPVTAHAALDKGCFYFNVECRKARIDPETYKVDLKHAQSLIDSNTIMLVGSAPNYPHGIVDPIPELAAIAKKRNIGMHVDACLGGFVLAFADNLLCKTPFNFSVDGVTSISIDHHKYGLAPKGVSALFFKTPELRQAQYFILTQWCGGLYATPTTCGSRSGAATAGAWYALVTNTQQVYRQNAKRIIECVRNITKKLSENPQIKVFGNPEVCAFGFTTRNISPYMLVEYLEKEKNWNLSTLSRPAGIHLSVTPANCEKAEKQLVKDINDAINVIKCDPVKHKGSKDAFYGGAAAIPSSTIKEDLLRVVMKCVLKG